MVPTEVGSEQIVDAMSHIFGVMEEVWGEGGSPYREFYKKDGESSDIIAWDPKDNPRDTDSCAFIVGKNVNIFVRPIAWLQMPSSSAMTRIPAKNSDPAPAFEMIHRRIEAIHGQ